MKFGEPLSVQYKNDMVMGLRFRGFDLISHAARLWHLPLWPCLGYTQDVGLAVNPFSFSHTNGLASGNVLEEAIMSCLVRSG